MKEFKSAYDIETAPKFGAGSEYGRDQREEARKKKFGMRVRTYNSDDQPWLLKIGTPPQRYHFASTCQSGDWSSEYCHICHLCDS